MRKLILPKIYGDQAAKQRIIEQEGELLKHISVSMNSMRLVGWVPSFENFMEISAWHDLSAGWTNRQKTKYRAWWDAIFTLERHPQDRRTVAIFIACCLQELAVRTYSKEPQFDPGSVGETDLEHVRKIRSYVREHYKQIDPEMGIGN